MAINRIECVRVKNNNISFKSIRQDLETARNLKTGTKPLSENKKLNIQAALNRLVKDSKEPEIEQMLDIAGHLSYGIPKNSRMSEIVNEEFDDTDQSEMLVWSEKLEETISQAISNQDDKEIQAKLTEKFNKVFSQKKPLTEEQKNILKSREAILKALSANLKDGDEETISQTATVKKLLDYFIISPDISDTQKKSCLEKINFFMTDDYKINPQLKDKKLQALTEILNDMTIKTPETSELLIKDVNQRQSGICAAISACRKAMAYEDKVRYLEIVMNELDDSKYMEVYDITHLGSGKKVKAEKPEIDYTDALRKNYRILDASAHIWMQLAGTAGTGNLKLQNYVAFDKDHYEIFRDSQWYPQLPEEYRLMQSTLRYKIKTKEYLKDFERLQKTREKYSNASTAKISKIADEAGRYKTELISVIGASLNDKDNAREIANSAIEFYKETGEDGTLNFHEKMPKEVKEEKLLNFLLSKTPKKDKKTTEALKARITQIHSLVQEYTSTEDEINKIKEFSSPKSHYKFYKNLFLIGASHRLGIEEELKDDTLLKKYEQELNLPPRHIQIEHDLMKRMQDTTLSKKELNAAARDFNTIVTVIPNKMDELLKVMTGKSTRELSIEYIATVADRIKGDKEYTKLFAEENNLKNSTDAVLKFLNEKTKQLKNNPTHKQQEEVLRILGFESNVGFTQSIFNTYLTYITTSGITESDVQRLQALSPQIPDAINEIAKEIVFAQKDVAKIEKRNSLQSRQEKTLKKMEQTGFVLSKKKLDALESRFDKIYDGLIQNESITDYKKRSSKNNDLYRTFTHEDKESLNSIETNVSKIKRHTEKTYNILNMALYDQLREQYGHIGKLQGHFWMPEEGASGLYTNQTLRILEQMTGKPYYIETDVSEAERVIRTGEGSGITSTSVADTDYAMHAQYVKSITDEIVSASKKGKPKTEAILWHDNSWGRSENEGSFLVGNRRYTDYQSGYGGKHGYIVNRDLTTGTPLKQLKSETGYSRTYKEIFPLFNNIILPGESNELNANIGEVFGHIYEILEIDDDVKTLEQKVSSGEKINLQGMEDLDDAAYKYADRLRNEIINKIKTKEDYNALSKDDPIKLNIEKLALYKALPSGLVKADLYSAVTREDFEETKQEILEELLGDVDTLFGKTPDAYDFLIKRCQEKYSAIREEINKATDFQATDEVVSSLFDKIRNVDDMELIPTGRLDSLQTTAIEQTKKVLANELQNPKQEEAVFKIFEKYIKETVDNDIRINSLDNFLIKNSPNTDRIIKLIEDHYNPRSDKELIQILQKWQNADYDEYTKETKWLKPKDLFTQQDPYEYIKQIQTMHSETAEDFDEMVIGSFITQNIDKDAESSYRKLMVRLSDLDINRYIKRFQEQMFTKYQVRPAFPQLTVMSDEEIDSISDIFFQQLEAYLNKMEETSKLLDTYYVYFDILDIFATNKTLQEADTEGLSVKALSKNEKEELKDKFQKLHDNSSLYTDLSNVAALSGEIIENLSLSKPNLSKLKRDFAEINTYFSELNTMEKMSTKEALTKTIKYNQKVTLEEFNTLKKYFIETNILPKYRDEANRLINKLASVNKKGNENDKNCLIDELSDFVLKNHITKKPVVLLNEFVKAVENPETPDYIKTYLREYLKKASKIAQLNKVEFKLVKNAQSGMATKTRRVMDSIKKISNDGQLKSSTSQEGLIYLAFILQNENTNNSTLNLFLTQTGLNEDCVEALIDTFSTDKRMETIDTYTQIIKESANRLNELMSVIDEFFNDNKMKFTTYSAAAKQLQKYVTDKYKDKSDERKEVAKRYTDMLDASKKINEEIPPKLVFYYLKSVNKNIMEQYVDEFNRTLDEVDNFKKDCQREENLIKSIDVNPTTKAGIKRQNFLEKEMPKFYEHLEEHAAIVNEIISSLDTTYTEEVLQ